MPPPAPPAARLRHPCTAHAVRWGAGMALGWGLWAQGVGAADLRLQVLDPHGRPLAGAVVSVRVGGVARNAPAGAQAEMAQRDRSFVPRVLVVQAGTPVHFPNFDTVRHHVYSFSPTKVFEIKLYAGTPTQPVVFDRPGTAVLGCNIHDTMVGFIHVVDTPHFGLTDAQGRWRRDLPGGRHTLQVWHAGMGQEQPPVVQTFELPATGTERVIRMTPP